MPFSWFTRKSKPIQSSPATQPSSATPPPTPEQVVEPESSNVETEFLTNPEFHKLLVKPTEDDEDTDKSWLDDPLNESEKNDQRIRLMVEKVSKINTNYHDTCYRNKLPGWCERFGKYDTNMKNVKLALLIFKQVFPEKMYTEESFNNVKGFIIEKNIRKLNEVEKDSLEKSLDNLLAESTSSSGGKKRKTKKRKNSKKTIKTKSRRKSKRKRS
jgi:hypothetical protein